MKHRHEQLAHMGVPASRPHDLLMMIALQDSGFNVTITHAYPSQEVYKPAAFSG